MSEKPKFTGALSKAAEENAKVKAPAKDYLDADTKVKYKGEGEPEIERPKFVTKHGEEPHFTEINKNEDVKSQFYNKFFI